MKTLGVCGCSWMAATQNADRLDLKDSEGKHFTELLAKRLGYNYKTLARGASSNAAIHLQVSEMIKQKVDFIVVGTTTSSRIEFPAEGKHYDPSLGVYNICYEAHPDQSSLNPNFGPNNLVSETISNFWSEEGVTYGTKRYPISKDQVDALKIWFEHLYDFKWKDQLDMWVLHSMATELKESGIPFIMLMQGYFNEVYFPSSDKRFIRDMSCFPWEWSKLSKPENVDRRWHTDDHSQEIGADAVFKYIKNNNILKDIND